jgi:hypothetical protein
MHSIVLFIINYSKYFCLFSTICDNKSHNVFNQIFLKRCLRSWNKWIHLFKNCEHFIVFQLCVKLCCSSFLCGYWRGKTNKCRCKKKYINSWTRKAFLDTIHSTLSIHMIVPTYSTSQVFNQFQNHTGLFT